MRVTREILIRIARETAQKQALSDPGLVAAYLTGSLRSEEPFLGRSTDIDITLVHSSRPKVRREILPLTPDVHLDLVHNQRSEYEKPKELRVHPRFGPELYDPLPLHVSGHFFEFVQAGVREKYHEPANVLARVRCLAGEARERWKQLQPRSASSPEQVLVYLKSIQLAAEAVAQLSGGPLAERRFLLQFPQCAAAAGEPGLAAGLLGLLGASLIGKEQLVSLLGDWEQSFMDAASRPRVHASIAPPRLAYYQSGLRALLEAADPCTIVWPLIRSWTRAAAVLPPTRQAKWLAACELLGLSGPGFPGRVEGLDAFLDRVDELVETTATSQGV